MSITYIYKSFSSAWCGLDLVEVGTRIASQMVMLPQCTGEAGINSEVCQLEFPTIFAKDFAFADIRLLMSEILESFRTEDFDIEYRSVNRFRFMGNGRTLRESGGEHYMQK